MLSNRLNHVHRLNLKSVTTAEATISGAIVWAAWVVAAQPGRTPALLLLSPFVLVPLALGLIIKATPGEQRLLRTVQAVTAPLALCAAASFALEQGLLAAALAVPWLLLTLTCALEGLLRLLGRRRSICADLGFDVGLVLIAIGGLWLVISRFGATFGFSEAIVELTAVHFHYAGFALPVAAGALARHRHAVAAVGGALPIAVTIGVAATALGITLGGAVEWVGATAMALVGLVVAAELAMLGAKQSGTGRGLLTIAGWSLAAGMVMALIWAWSIWFGVRGPGLDLMVATHGSLNAIGFGLVGLLGLHTVAFVDRGERRGLRVGRVGTEELAALAGAPGSMALGRIDALGGVPDGWRRDRFDTTGAADVADARAAMRAWVGHRAAGIDLAGEPPIEVGRRLALAIPALGGLTVTACAVITDVIDEPDRFGFTYACTHHHPMDGAETFIVERDGEGVRLTVSVIWRPAILGARLVPPLTRWLQRRALARFMTAIVGASALEASQRMPINRAG